MGAVGEQPDDYEYRILSHSTDRLSHGNFAEILARYSPGVPVSLPQVTVGWAGHEEPWIGLAIHGEHPDLDRRGRRIITTRYFCLLYDQICQQPVSFEALYRAFDEHALQADGSPFTLAVPALDPGLLASRVDQTAMGAVALLMTGHAVCIVGGDSVPMLQRLQFLDTVAALLPYGMRTRLSASTWTGIHQHRISLSFGDIAHEAYSVT